MDLESLKHRKLEIVDLGERALDVMRQNGYRGQQERRQRRAIRQMKMVKTRIEASRQESLNNSFDTTRSTNCKALDAASKPARITLALLLVDEKKH